MNNRETLRQHSLEMITSDDDIPQLSQQTTESNRTLNSSRMNLNKLKDQITNRARTVLNKSPSLTSVLTNTSSPEIVYWIEVCIERGKDLSIKDFTGTSDPYVKVCYNNEEKYTTNTIYKNLNPVWNEKFSFFVNDLNIPIYFNIYDYDRIGRDEPMGTTKIDLSKLPIEQVYNATLELENEKRADGKIGSLKISITITQKTSEFRDEILKTLSKQSNRKVSLTTRSGGNTSNILTRRTIDIFVIEGKNFNKILNPYIRLKFGTNKKYRTQVEFIFQVFLFNIFI
jgi:Ca2+-dependent lipid-binding protein